MKSSHIESWGSRMKKRKEELEKLPMEERVIRGLQQVWREIGGDILTMPGSNGRVTGQEVRECVPDYYYTRTDEAAEEWFRKQDRKAKDLLLLKAFPHRHYGL